MKSGRTDHKQGAGWLVMLCCLFLVGGPVGQAQAAYRLATGVGNIFALDLQPVPARVALAESNVFAFVSEEAISRLVAERSNVFVFVAPLTVTIDTPTHGAVLLTQPIAVSGTVSEEVETITLNGLPVLLDGLNWEIAAVDLQEGENLLRAEAALGERTANAEIRVTLSSPPLGPVDISDQVQVAYGGLFVDRRRGRAKVNVSLENISDQALAGPLSLVLVDIAPASVRPSNADGTTAAGLPFYEMGGLHSGDVLAPGAQTALRTLEFDNPDRVRFTLEAQVLQGVLAAKGLAGGIPAYDRLAQNAPNPFNPQTRIAYRLADGGPVSLVIYNMLGQPVRTLVKAEQSAGSYAVQWDGRDGAGRMLGSGLYHYTLRTTQGKMSRRMVLLR